MSDEKKETDASLLGEWENRSQQPPPPRGYDNPYGYPPRGHNVQPTVCHWIPVKWALFCTVT